MHDRKNQHIDLALSLPQRNNHSFDQYVFEHNAIPEIEFADIDTSVPFLGKRLALPLIVASMTGGTEKAAEINQRLAQLCEKKQIGMGLGSQRIAIEHEEARATFEITRKLAPTALLIGNIGAVQLNYGYTERHIQEAINMIDADGLFLHLNPLQEAIQPEGDRNFSNLLPKITTIAKKVSKPILIKEVGNGISKDVAQRIKQAGINYIATEGTGGTNWALIEGARAGNSLGEQFQQWGIPTTESIVACNEIKGMTIIAGGGLKNGIDIAKAVALGASIASMGGVILKAVLDSIETAENRIDQLQQELKIVMFCTGCKTIEELQQKGPQILKKVCFQ